MPFRGVNPKIAPKKQVELNPDLGLGTSNLPMPPELSEEELIQLTKQFVNVFSVLGTSKEDPEAPTIRDLS